MVMAKSGANRNSEFFMGTEPRTGRIDVSTSPDDRATQRQSESHAGETMSRTG